MGLPAARLKDLCTGHGVYPPRPTNKASQNVYVNSRGSHRMTDTFEEHCSPLDCHPGMTIQGSATVFINGLPAARAQDPVDCGSFIMTGSKNVFIG